MLAESAFECFPEYGEAGWGPQPCKEDKQAEFLMKAVFRGI
jgi:hypothetical protein